MILSLSECDELLVGEELRAVGYIPPGWRALSTAQPQAIAVTVSLESLASLPKGNLATTRRVFVH